MPKMRYHVFVCTAAKPDKAPQGFCQKKGGVEIFNAFFNEIQERELGTEGVQITCTSCLGLCPTEGPCAVVYGEACPPEGIWYAKLDEDAVEEICEQHFEGGTPVEKYLAN